jgi:hypothetical protein
VNGTRYTYVFVDQFSLYCILVPAQSKTTAEILRAFRDHVIAKFNLPYALRSDRESGIAASEDFKTFAEQHCIKLLLTASHSPFSNSLAEQRVKWLKLQLRSIILSTAKTDWPEMLYLVQLVLNTTPSHYRFSPQEILFGLESNEPKRLLNEPPIASDPEEYAQVITKKLQKYWTEMSSIREKHQSKSRDYANRARVYKHFKVGDYVYIRNQVITGPSGLQNRNSGPAEVEKIYPKSSTADVRDCHTNMRTKQHFGNLVPVSAFSQALPMDWDEFIRSSPKPRIG